jgi:hypothetical protein
VCEDALPVSTSQAPEALILCPVLPLHGAEAMAEAALPVSNISCTCALIYVFLLNDRCLFSIWLLLESLLEFFVQKVALLDPQGGRAHQHLSYLSRLVPLPLGLDSD